MEKVVQKRISGSLVRELASDCGFVLAGVSRAVAAPDFERFKNWASRGLAGEMGYLTDHRADVRADVGNLLPGTKSVISVGFPYSGPEPCSTAFSDRERAWISRYAWGDDYHAAIRSKLKLLAHKLMQTEVFQWRACVDTAPLLERSFAARAGLGWIGKNTCLIDQKLGSFFFLGELLTTLDIGADSPVPDRCGSCSRCIDACPTAAIVPSPDGRFELDARLCIAYFTIELRSTIPESQRAAIGNHIFGCDICQDVCPWNRKAPHMGIVGRTELVNPPLDRLAELSETEFRDLFRNTPVNRAKYNGFVRNIAVAMGNSGLPKFRAPLEKLAASDDLLVVEHALWALARLDS